MDALATRKLFGGSTEALADLRQVRVVCSTSDVDRMGDVIVQSGIDLADYLKNPVVLWGHDADYPVARAVEIGIKSGKLQATVQFPPEGEDADADWVYGKIKSGIVNATSVGFLPREYEPLDPKQPWGGYKFLKSELLEFSFVSIPANAGCLVVGRSIYNGIDLPVLPSRAKADGIVETVEEPALTSDVSVGRDFLEELFRQAKTPRTVRQKYLAKADVSDWKVGASRDLPTDDADGWDGPAAAKRMLDAAGFDGDSPDAEKAARGFLVHDSANPTLRGSYKLPFADIVGGTLKAIKGGVSAAKGRLDQTDAPAAVLEEAKGVIDAYEAKFGEAKSAPTLSVIVGGLLTPDQARIALGLDARPIEDKAIQAPVEKSGRKLSSASEALVREAMDHHVSATKCLQTLLDSNATVEPADENNIEIPLTGEDKRLKRLRDAKALAASVKG